MTSAEQDGRMDYVEFPTTDIEATKAFYAQAFGWEFTDYGPDYTSFSDGRLSGGFTTQARGGEGGPLIVLYAADLEQTERRVREAGGHIVRAIFSFPGGRRFHFTDPGGNELAAWSEP